MGSAVLLYIFTHLQLLRFACLVCCFTCVSYKMLKYLYRQKILVSVYIKISYKGTEKPSWWMTVGKAGLATAHLKMA